MTVEPSTDPRPPRERWRWAPSPDRAIAVAYVCAIFMTGIDMQIVNVALPTLSSDFDAPLSDVAVDGDRLPADAGGGDPGLGLDRRPDRDQADLPLRARPLHRRLGALRRGAVAAAADRGARAAGSRRRPPDADRHLDALPRLRPRAAGAGRPHPDPADPDRARRGADHRRRADPDALLALGVPDQRPGRGRDGRLRLALRPRAPALTRRPARPRAACCSPASA